MIRDYLYQISNIIYDNQISGVEPTARKRIDTKREIDQVIKANKIVLKMIKKPDLNLRTYSNYEIRQSGSGLDELSSSIDEFSGINDKLQNLLERMRGDIAEPGINKKITDVSKEIKEIAEVAIVLIKFLGELIELNQDESLKEVQQQVADIVLGLEKYLA